MKIIRLLCLGALFSFPVSAKTFFKGYPEAQPKKTATLTKTIVRFKVQKKDIYILFNKQPTLYRFPRETDIENQVIGFLKSRIKSKKKVKIRYAPLSSKIFSIEDFVKNH